MQMEEDSLLTIPSNNKIISHKIEILKQQQSHQEIVEYICDQEFGKDRKYKRTSYHFRHNIKPVEKLCFVAKNERDIIVATIRFWNILIGDQKKPQLLLGPVAVRKEYQKKGYATQIIKFSLNEARKMQYQIVLLVGDAQYFAKMGFRKTPDNNIIMPEDTDKNKICYYEFIKNSLQIYYGKVKRYYE